MASISANGSRGHHNFTLNVTETGINQSANTSTVHFELVLAPIQAYWNWAISGINYGITIDGQNFTGSIPSYDGVSTVVIRSGDITVGHNNDGSKLIGFSFSINDGANKSYTPGSCSASGSMALTNIARQAIVTNATDFTDETNPTVTFNNNGGYRINARLEFAGSFIQRDNIQNTGTYTFELTNEERELLRSKTPNSNSMTVREVIATYINSESETHWSWQDKTMTIVNANPTFENFTYEDTNTDVTNITENNQVLVKGLSTLEVTIPTSNKMVAKKSATPKNYVTTIDTINQSANYDDEDNIVFDLDSINASGTQRLNVRAYDSRNNSTLVYKDITVYDYAKPIIHFTAERLNNFENQTTLKVSGSFSSLNINNVEKNDIQSVKYRYRESDSETWTNWGDISFTITDNNYNCSDVILALDNTKEFYIEVKVEDNLSNNDTSLKIDVGKSIFFISSNEKKCYINDYEVATFNRVYPIGSIYMNINNTNPNELFGIGTWEQIEGRFLLGANSNYAAGTTGGKEKVRLNAAIGSYDNSINTLGFVGDTASAYQLNNGPTYVVTGGNTSATNMGNHSTIVTERDVNDRDVTIMPPYLVVYIWKRVA